MNILNRNMRFFKTIVNSLKITLEFNLEVEIKENSITYKKKQYYNFTI